MTSHFTCLPRLRRASSAALLLGLISASGAHAQVVPTDRSVAAVEVASIAPPAPQMAGPVQSPGEVQPRRVRRIDIGSASEALWDMQRASPGARARPIDGDQASRSYQRYLKSFETTIPEHYNAGLDLAKK